MIQFGYQAKHSSLSQTLNEIDSFCFARLRRETQKVPAQSKERQIHYMLNSCPGLYKLKDYDYKPRRKLVASILVSTTRLRLQAKRLRLHLVPIRTLLYCCIMEIQRKYLKYYKGTCLLIVCASDV